MSNADVRHLDTWAEFLGEVLTIEREIKERSSNTIGHYSRPLYRGQANADWKLETTLERECKRPMTLEEYHDQYVSAAHTILSGYQQKHWKFDPQANAKYQALDYQRVPNYEFMAYLRHHGFPSPLLDWTSSPYVAAFFAFDPAYTSERVAVFWYQEYMGRGKSTSSAKPRIFAAGPFAAIHPRHFVQQSEYTVCYEMQKEDALFVSHERVINEKGIWPQDAVIKFTLPSSLRYEVLYELNRMNINPYSVYQSEDALVRTVGSKVFIDGAMRRALFEKHKEIIKLAREGVNAPWDTEADT
jgi:hypothetical protein